MSTTTKEPIPVVPSAPPDPRVLIGKSAAVQREVEKFFKIAMEALHSQSSSVEAIVAELSREAEYKDLEPRHLAFKAGEMVELLEHLFAALAHATEQHERNLLALAAHQETMATLHEQTSVRDANLAGGAREQVAGIFAADVDLMTVVNTVEKMRPAIKSDVTRFVWACGIVARRARCARVTRQLDYARSIVEGVRAQRLTWTAEDEPLLTLLDSMSDASGELLLLPELEWPTTPDPFAPPTLREP